MSLQYFALWTVCVTTPSYHRMQCTAEVKLMMRCKCAICCLVTSRDGFHPEWNPALMKTKGFCSWLWYTLFQTLASILCWISLCPLICFCYEILICLIKPLEQPEASLCYPLTLCLAKMWHTELRQGPIQNKPSAQCFPLLAFGSYHFQHVCLLIPMQSGVEDGRCKVNTLLRSCLGRHRVVY